MKAQFAPGVLRVRVDRLEFERLRSGEAVRLDCAGAAAVEVRQGDRLSVEATRGEVHLRLPAGELDALGARLPSREGIEATIGLAGRMLRLAFEVDVRDGRAGRSR